MKVMSCQDVKLQLLQEDMIRAEERQIYLRIGICPLCHKNYIEPNKKACFECLGRERDRYYEKRISGKCGLWAESAGGRQRCDLVRA